MSRLAKMCNSRGRTPEKEEFFKVAVLMHNSRNRKNKPREYCSGANLKTIYNMLEAQRPELLFYYGKKLTYKEYESIIVEYLENVKKIIIEGSPVILPGKIGAIGIKIKMYDRQLPSSRFKKDKDKEYVQFPTYEIFHQKRHLYKSASPLIDIDKHRIEFTKDPYHEIINRYLKNKLFYYRTGEHMNQYARRIRYNGTVK